MRKSSGWIIAICITAGAVLGWYWGASEVKGIEAGLRARGEVGDEYPIIALFSPFPGAVLELFVGLTIVGIRRLLQRKPAA